MQIKNAVLVLFALVLLAFSVSTPVVNAQLFSKSQEATLTKSLDPECSTCQGLIGDSSKKPESTGSKKDQTKAVQLAKSQESYQNLKSNSDIELVSVNVIENTTQATVVFKVSNSADGLAVLTYYVDFQKNEALEQKIYAVEINEGKLVNLRWTLQDKTLIDINVNSKGKVIDKGHELTLDQYFVEYKNEIQKKTEEVVKEASLCVWAVGLLCAAGTSAGCYALCGVTAIVNVLGGAGCAVACGVIFGGGGCIGGTTLICG